MPGVCAKGPSFASLEMAASVVPVEAGSGLWASKGGGEICSKQVNVDEFISCVASLGVYRAVT